MDVLPDETYTFQVRARDEAGNPDATPATWEFSKVSVLSFSQETGEAAAEYILPDELTEDVPANCGGNPAIDCPGGNPAPPSEQIYIISTRSVVRVDGANRYDVTASMIAQTMLPMKVNFSGIECDLTFNSTNGTTPTWTANLQLNVLTHPTFGERYTSGGNTSVSGIQDADFGVSGNFLCSVTPSSFFSQSVEDLVTTLISDRAMPLCMAPGPQLFETCHWVDQ